MSDANNPSAPPADWDRSGLPAWSYLSEELLELEKEELFRRHWQLVCHTSDLPKPGDYLTLDIVGERALVIRGRDNEVRAFHNVCRHRGSRVVADERGNCKSAIICPFHGWAYNLDGTLHGPAEPKTLPRLDPVEFGLPPVEMEIWHGFVFIRFKPGPQPSIAQVLSRFESEIAPYELDALVPAEEKQWRGSTAVNWKSVRDVDNEGYHVPQAHPGLQQLYGGHYFDEPFVDGTSRSFAQFSKARAPLWSVRAYKNILPEAHWLPESHQRAWLYVGVFPNFVFALYPDSVHFYQEFPVAWNRTELRGRDYRRPDESRSLRAARYLSGRIDNLTGVEDQLLTIWSWEASQSSGYQGVVLSDLEYGVRSYHDELRAIFPVLNEETIVPGTVAARNEALKLDNTNTGSD